MPEYYVKRVQQPVWESVPAVTLTHAPWLNPNAVAAQAQLCHDTQNLYLRMTARENPIRATLTEPLAQVCQDSCLEFFLAPVADDARYLNFECNPLGTLYLGFGAQRDTRVRQLVRDVGMFHIAPFETDDGWGLTMQIPLSFLRLYFPNLELTGHAACNFYKCGDETASPHYLSWAPLSSDTPDFHRRWDFGTLIFE